MLLASRTFRTPTWANPLEAPTPSTRAIFACLGGGFTSLGAHASIRKRNEKIRPIILTSRLTPVSIKLTPFLANPPDKYIYFPYTCIEHPYIITHCGIITDR